MERGGVEKSQQEKFLGPSRLFLLNGEKYQLSVMANARNFCQWMPLTSELLRLPR